MELDRIAFDLSLELGELERDSERTEIVPPCREGGSASWDERTELVLARLDDPDVRLRHLVPRARKVPERLGDDDPRLVRQLGDLRQLGMERLEGVEPGAESRASASRPRSSSGTPTRSARQ